jgi:hypothetical protein
MQPFLGNVDVARVCVVKRYPIRRSVVLFEVLASYASMQFLTLTIFNTLSFALTMMLRKMSREDNL